IGDRDGRIVERSVDVRDTLRFHDPLRLLPCGHTLLGYLLLSGDRAARTLLRARVGMRPLPANGEAAAVTNSAVRADVHQALDVSRGFRPPAPLDPELLLDHLTELVHVGVGEIADPLRRIDPG